MKSTLQYLALVSCLFAGMTAVHAQGVIVPNGVTFGGFQAGSGYKISVIDNPSGTASIFSTNTQFWLNPAGKTQPTTYTNTFSLVELADIGVRVFLVSSNDPVSLSSIQSGTYAELTSSAVFQSGVPFYLALYTGYQFGPPYPPNPPYNYLDPVYGWVQLVNNQGAIQMLGGALEYGGPGIFAGTQNLIQPAPEPGVLALGAMGALAICVSFRKKQAA